MSSTQLSSLHHYSSSIFIEHNGSKSNFDDFHKHPEYEITCITRGDGILQVGNDIHSFTSGDIFCIGANSPHMFKSKQVFNNPVEYKFEAYSLYFNPHGLISGLFNLPEMTNLKLFLNHHKNGFKIPSNNSKHVENDLRELYNSSGPDILLKFLNLLNKFTNFNDLIPLLSISLQSKIEDHAEERIKKVIDYTIKHYFNQISLNEVAGITYMSPEAFCRLFKKCTGSTYIAFLNEIRVQEVCKMLRNIKSAEYISIIAYKSGFNSITNFNRTFKKITGLSPKDYQAKTGTRNIKNIVLNS